MRRSGRTLAKYIALEIPGWILVAGVLAFLVHRYDLDAWIAFTLFALWVIKDFALYPVLSIAYEDANPEATEGLIGALGTATDRIDREGWVRIGSELWRAELTGEAPPVEAGGAVRVRRVDGLVLRIEPA